MPRKIKQEDWVKDCSKTHENFYDYSLVKYINSSTSVTIICPSHGIFEQLAGHHRSGRGCPRCGNEKVSKKLTYSTEDFIKKSNNVHNQRYDYTTLVYSGHRNPVKILCKEHGEFTQTAYTHLAGHGCPACNRKDFSTFIKQAKSIHGEKYKYNESTYSGVTNKMEIICPEHGTFTQLPSNHIKGSGCPKCANKAIGDALRMPQDEFIRRCKELFGDKYDYSLVEYKSCCNRVSIVCKEHGVFKKSPQNMLSLKQGCPSCSTYGFNTMMPSFLYVLKSEQLLKVGITNRDVGLRIDEINNHSGKKFSLVDVFEGLGQDVYDTEQTILRSLRMENKVLEEVFDGSTECFTLDNMDKLYSLLGKLTPMKGLTKRRLAESKMWLEGCE